jgi:hypothetical protein
VNPNQRDAPEVVVLTHKPDAPSFRHRLRPVFPELEARGYRTSFEVMPSGPVMLRVLTRRRRLSSAAAVVLAKTKLTPEAWLLGGARAGPSSTTSTMRCTLP